MCSDDDEEEEDGMEKFSQSDVSEEVKKGQAAKAQLSKRTIYRLSIPGPVREGRGCFNCLVGMLRYCEKIRVNQIWND